MKALKKDFPKALLLSVVLDTCWQTEQAVYSGHRVQSTSTANGQLVCMGANHVILDFFSPWSS